MPQVNDYDQNDEDSAGREDGYSPAQSAAIGSATGGPKQAPRQVQEQQGYVPWQSFVNANADVSKREAGKLQGKVQGDVTQAQHELGDEQNTFDVGVDSNYGSGASRGSRTSGAKPQPGQSMVSTGANAAAAEPAAAQTSDPWSSFLPPSQTTSIGPGPSASATPPAAPSPTSPVTASAPQSNYLAPASPQMSPQMGGAQLDTDPLRLSGVAADGKPTGSPDLEAAAGNQAWAKLLGDTTRATGEAHALGSEGGVEALLQRGQTSPVGNTAFDAALVNGQGQRDFQALDRQYGGHQLQKGVVDAEKASQDRWAKLRGDIAARQMSDSGTHAPAATPDAATQAPGADAPPAADDGWDDAAWQSAQQAGQQLEQQYGDNISTELRSGDPGRGSDPNGPSQAGSGLNRGAFGLERPSINVWGKTPEEQAANWWGGVQGAPFPGSKNKDGSWVGGIDAATWWALSQMTPEQRAAWWKHNHPNGS